MLIIVVTFFEKHLLSIIS